MKYRGDDGVVCRLKEVRTLRGITQTALAERVGLKRQAIYDIESGRYLPNTAVALKLSRELGCRVEDIFRDSAEVDGESVDLAEEPAAAGRRLLLARVRDRLVGYPLADGVAGHPGILPADGLLDRSDGRVRLLGDAAALEKCALLLGCDPAFSVLNAHVGRTPGSARVRWRFASSYRAMEGLSAGRAHIAGVHLHNTGGEESNVALARRLLGETGGRLIAFARFEEGLMVAPGNPLNLRGAADLAREDVRIANREPGAALRILLDDLLEKAGIPPEAVRGYEDRVSGHFEGAQRVAFGKADAAPGLRAVAVSQGLDFVPLSEVRCDLVVPADMLDHPAVVAAMDVLQTRAFRDELSTLPGYDAVCTGDAIAAW
jgi:putative molybdopterin biosynthesis protein